MSSPSDFTSFASLAQALEEIRSLRQYVAELRRENQGHRHQNRRLQDEIRELRSAGRRPRKERGAHV